MLLLDDRARLLELARSSSARGSSAGAGAEPARAEASGRPRSRRLPRRPARRSGLSRGRCYTGRLPASPRAVRSRAAPAGEADSDRRKEVFGSVTDYEILLMLDPELPEERQNEIVTRAREPIENDGGTWDAHEPWGRRRLAYEIDHKPEGIYHLLLFAAEPETLDEISRILKITDGVMRHLAVRRVVGSTARPPEPMPEEPVAAAAADAGRMKRPRAAPQRAPERRASNGQHQPRRPRRQPDRDPELRHTPSGTAVCKLRLAVNTRRKDGQTGEWARQAELLRRHRLGQPGRELRAVPLQGPPGRGRRPPRLARVGRPGRHQAPGGRDHRRHRPVPRQPRQDDEGGGQPQFVPAARSRPTTPTSAAAPPTTTSRSDGRSSRRQRQQRRAAGRAPGGPIRKRNCFFCKEKVDEVDYKNINQLRRYISEKGKIRSRRITGACRRHQRQVAVAVKRAREMALSPTSRARWTSSSDRTSTRSASAARSSTSRAATRATSCCRASSPRRRRRRRSPSCASARSSARATRRRRVEQAQEIAETLEDAELRFDVKAGPTGTLFGSVTPTDIADELWETQKVRVDRRKIDLPDSIKRIGRYEVPIELFDDVDRRRCTTLVVPEGGELPPRGGARGDRRRPRRRPRQPRRPRQTPSTSGRGRDRGRRRRGRAELRAGRRRRRGRAGPPKTRSSRAADAAAELRRGDAGAARLVAEAHRLLHSARPRRCGIRHELPAPSGGFRPQASSGASWEHVFPYACKPATSHRVTALSKAASSRPSTTAAAVLG